MKTMNKEFKKRKSENLSQWIERLAPAIQGRSLVEVHEILRELSWTSYVCGSDAAAKINKKQ